MRRVAALAAIVLAAAPAAGQAPVRDSLSVGAASPDGLEAGAARGAEAPAPAADDLSVGRGGRLSTAAETTTGGGHRAAASAAEATYAVERAERSVTIAILRGVPAADVGIARTLARQARRALEEGRTAEALSLARRAVEEIERALSTVRVEERPPDPPTTEAIFRAESLLRARAAAGAAAWRLETARELIDAARASTRTGDFTAAEDLARRAAALLEATEEEAPAPPAPAAPPVHLNAASEEDLAALPGMTLERVRAILWWRRHMGPFTSVEELRFVPGFDSYYVLLLRDRLTVRPPR